MEAKETITSACALCSSATNQAEISFKAGKHEGYWIGYGDGKQAGIKEVVEWIEEHQRMTYEQGKGEVAFNHVNWHTKLEEWGL